MLTNIIIKNPKRDNDSIHPNTARLMQDNKKTWPLIRFYQSCKTQAESNKY
jgi:hypothetical protein